MVAGTRFELVLEAYEAPEVPSSSTPRRVRACYCYPARAARTGISVVAGDSGFNPIREHGVRAVPRACPLIMAGSAPSAGDPIRRRLG